MLGKLIRHEWRSMWRIPTLLIAGLFAAAVLSGVTSGSSVFRYVSGGTAENEILQILNAILVVTFFLMLAACSMGIFLYLSVHFYRKMYSDEGYLTHTLPVTVHQILISKIIVMVCWILLNALAVLASGVVFGGLVIWGSGQVSPEELAQIAETIGEVLSHIDWTETGHPSALRTPWDPVFCAYDRGSDVSRPVGLPPQDTAVRCCLLWNFYTVFKHSKCGADALAGRLDLIQCGHP